MSRQCGDCTKCCEGYLTGAAYNKAFFPGRPCHFVTIGKGCTIYARRPKDPCVSYTCQWIANSDIPEWMKPDEINAIFTKRKFEDSDIEFIDLVEAGETLRAGVLSWFIMYAMEKGLNARWQVDGGQHWIGSKEFLDAMNKNITK